MISYLFDPLKNAATQAANYALNGIELSFIDENGQKRIERDRQKTTDYILEFPDQYGLNGITFNLTLEDIRKINNATSQNFAVKGNFFLESRDSEKKKIKILTTDDGKSLVFICDGRELFFNKEYFNLMSRAQSSDEVNTLNVRMRSTPPNQRKEYQEGVAKCQYYHLHKTKRIFERALMDTTNAIEGANIAESIANINKRLDKSANTMASKILPKEKREFSRIETKANKDGDMEYAAFKKQQQEDNRRRAATVTNNTAQQTKQYTYLDVIKSFFWSMLPISDQKKQPEQNQNGGFREQNPTTNHRRGGNPFPNM